MEVLDQHPVRPKVVEGRWIWDIDQLLAVCREAILAARDRCENCTIAIDSWGVDHGFVDQHGKLVQPVVCYRDPSHERAFQEMSAFRHELFQLTGIQHQPFNTVYQLASRLAENPSLACAGTQFMILPDLLGFFLSGAWNMEQTQASTTQLMGLDGKWCDRAFEICGWPKPQREPTAPGRVLADLGEGVSLVSVGSHDTASAVCGLGSLDEGEAFLNVGTWSLLGCVTPQPIVTDEAEEGGFSNERTVDGQVRLLTNIPGFYVVNRLHEELEVGHSVAEWVASASPCSGQLVDLMDPRFFNPRVMREEMTRHINWLPNDLGAWASLAISSLVATIGAQLMRLESVTRRQFHSVRLSGGGSMSARFCQMLADVIGRPVVAGPMEATLYGNLSVQFLAQGIIDGFGSLGAWTSQSLALRSYVPGGSS